MQSKTTFIAFIDIEKAFDNVKWKNYNISDFEEIKNYKLR